MDAAEIRKAAARAIGEVAERQGRASRWSIATDELLWVFELDRGASWSRWAPLVGCAVRAWHQTDPRRVADCDVVIDYTLMPLGVPPAAVGTRFNDHRSYFTMVFDHTHDLLGPEARLDAFAFMAQEMRNLGAQLSTAEALRCAVGEGMFRSGFVRPRLR
ncbi:hypothetical protein [Nocardioides conyzicola]|uniref:Uncharacterized protein n=1 Tax=Nocardioides conyzicola TaxID=1651781 RepID=A0ABP8XYI3_9ACTN